ncbi:MAG: bifunctional DedA family/phosphatase PAP2 family protein [Actinobacteria bacterium]|nr:bifunctional DedA family/phosphatase PAP2 family protein [Actinomycetota bacterium]
MDFLLSIAEPWAYLAVAGLAAAESAVFAGLLLPGEATMLLAGVLVFQGRADLSVMLLAGCSGAVAGDSIGYLLGRRFGSRLMAGRMGRRVGRKNRERAQGYLREKDGRAIFVGRFVGVLRALMPAIAGSAGLPYRSFLPHSAAGGVLWAGGFILLGVVAGRSWRVVEGYAGQASLVLAIIAAFAAALYLAARWLQSHLEEVQRMRDEFLERPRVKGLRTRFRPQVEFLMRRLDPSQRFGLYLTVGLALAVGGAGIFGTVLHDVLGREELSLFDRPIVRWFIAHRDPVLNTTMEVITFLGGSLAVSVTLSAAALITFWRTRQKRWVVFFVATMLGGLLLDDFVKGIVDRPRPAMAQLVEVSGSSFPSGHSTAIAAACTALAYVLTRRRGWKGSVTVWAIAVFVALLVALSRVYLGVHWPTDVLGGLALGSFWTAATATAATVIPADTATGKQGVLVRS